MAWDYFVILAGMRTGSNFLEANLNEYPGLKCHGELFNRHFVGHAGKDALWGISLAAREDDPMALVAMAREKTQGLAGFRLFHDHDSRVIDTVMADPKAAKIVLSRNPLESYVSLRIASETGQWRLGDMKNAKTARVGFDREEFRRHLAATRAFQDQVIRELQETGQTGFFITYDDVGEVEVMNGLARWLGVAEARRATSSKTKKQNPEGLDEKVTNYAEMVAALADVDHFDLGRYPVFEPRRGPTVPQFVTAAKAPLLFMPIRSGPNGAVRRWLARLDGVPEDHLQSNFTQNSLRQWMREHVGHRSFAVLRHPVARLHDAFCRHILPGAPAPLPDLRAVLAKTFKLTLPDSAEAVDVEVHRAGFKAFARFVHGNLSGQTSVRVDAAWASQLAVMQGFAQFGPPDHILREDDLDMGLHCLAEDAGVEPPPWVPADEIGPHPLAEIYDDEIEVLVRQAYQRDYVNFGFDRWR